MRLRFAFCLALIPALCAAASSNAPTDSALPGHLRAGHPRLLFTNEQLADALAAAKTDPFRAALHQRIVTNATAELATAPIRHELIGPRLLDKSRTCIARVLTCAMAYRLTGDARFADRAKKELLTAAAFADWNPSHFLDIAEMSFAFAIGYDWLYPQLSPDERATLKRALMEKSLVFAPAAYGPGAPTDKRVWFVTARHNWNQVCNGGFLAAALALADEEPALAKLIVAGARRSLPLAMEAYQPDGAYPEGPGYWGYGTGYNVLAIAMLQSALGTDLGLSDAPAFDRTVVYRLYVQGPSGLGFNYADGGAGLGPQPEYTWLAQRFRQPTALAHSRALLQEALARRPGNPDSDRFFALHAVWFPAANAAPEQPPSLDARFRGHAELAFLRSDWIDPAALFVGFKAGRNDVNHAHLDLGSFVVDADGVRWVEDLGPDNYNLPGYFDAKGPRWQYYRLNNRSHNVVTVGDHLQDPHATAPITAFESAPDHGFVIADLSRVYPGVHGSLRRGIAMLDRSRVLVQDECNGAAAGTGLTWRVLSSAHVAVDAPRHATLTLRGATMEVQILSPADARFSTAPARPPTAEENQNRGVTELSAHLTSTKPETTIAVLFTPVGAHWPTKPPAPAIRPLASWPTHSQQRD